MNRDGHPDNDSIAPHGNVINVKQIARSWQLDRMLVVGNLCVTVPVRTLDAVAINMFGIVVELPGGLRVELAVLRRRTGPGLAFRIDRVL